MTRNSTSQLNNALHDGQGAHTFLAARGSQCGVVSGHCKRPKARRTGALKLGNGSHQVFVSHARCATFESAPQCLASPMLFSLHGWLHHQRHGRAHGQRHASRHDRPWVLLQRRPGGGAATNQLHHIEQHIKPMVKPLVGLIKPVAVFDIKQSIVAHVSSFELITSAWAAAEGDAKAAFARVCRIHPTALSLSHLSCWLPDVAELLFCTTIFAQRRGAGTHFIADNGTVIA